MFLERLTAINSRIKGSLALSLVGWDGIPVESISNDPDLDLELLAAELVAELRTLTENHRELGVGQLKQFTVTTDRLTFIVSSVTNDYYLLLVLGDNGSFGRARYELRRARLLLEPDL